MERLVEDPDPELRPFELAADSTAEFIELRCTHIELIPDRPVGPTVRRSPRGGAAAVVMMVAGVVFGIYRASTYCLWKLNRSFCACAHVGSCRGIAGRTKYAQACRPYGSRYTARRGEPRHGSPPSAQSSRAERLRASCAMDLCVLLCVLKHWPSDCALTEPHSKALCLIPRVCVTVL